MNDRERERRRIIRLHRELIRECQQIINDVQYWNRTRTDSPPLDCEAERVLKQLMERQLAAFVERNPEPPAG